MNNDVVNDPPSTHEQGHEPASSQPITSSPTSSPSSPSHDAATGFRSRVSKHITVLGSLHGSLDVAFFVNLSAMYYLDCRLSTFLLRAVPQVLILSPRLASAFQPPTAFDPLNQPLIGGLFTTNIICLLAHIFGTGPRASEATQFYVYGGIFVDFIGEKTPVSKLRLILLDILVCALQLIILAVMVEKARLTKIQSSYTASTSSATATATTNEGGTTTTAPARSSTTPASGINETGTQTVEDEERGVSALAEDPLLQDDLADSDTDSLEERLNTRNSPHAHPLDSFTTGRHMIADINLAATVRGQWAIWKRSRAPTPTPATATAGAGTTDPASEAGDAAGATGDGFRTLIGPFGFRVRVREQNIGT